MAIKLDLEKAYDRLSWEFIRSTLKETGINMSWINLIMHCVQSPCMSILWNGDRLQEFIRERGIRQGDAMSPALFVLCIEKLSQMIIRKVEAGSWKGIRLVDAGPTLSHLCFADDIVLFTEATLDQIAIIRDCLDRFCAASGQRISFSKSQILFSRNTHPEVADEIATALGVEKTADLGKYLGVPSIHGRVTCSTYDGLLDRLNARLDGWKTNLLSMAGRVTLAKAVLNAIPFYRMQTTVLPKGVCQEIEKKIRRFIWGSHTDGHHKISLKSGIQ